MSARGPEMPGAVPAGWRPNYGDDLTVGGIQDYVSIHRNQDGSLSNPELQAYLESIGMKVSDIKSAEPALGRAVEGEVIVHELDATDVELRDMAQGDSVV